jgi:hypothetical protein
VLRTQRPQQNLEVGSTSEAATWNAGSVSICCPWCTLTKTRVGLTLAALALASAARVMSVRNGASTRHTGEGRCPDTSVVEAVPWAGGIPANPRVEML